MGPLAETIAVVVPVYNEAETIEDVVREIGLEVISRFASAEVIVVDDASTDETGAILARLAKNALWLRIERPDQNCGHGASVRRGLELARADWIFQLDSDGQFVVRDFWHLWDRREDADLVLGVRVARRDSRHRRILSRTLAATASALSGRRLHDPNVPFRLVRRAVWEDVRTFLAPDSVAPSVLVAVGAVVRRWRVVEVPVVHLPRVSGESSLRAFRLASFMLRAFAQLLAFPAALRGGHGGLTA